MKVYRLADLPEVDTDTRVVAETEAEVRMLDDAPVLMVPFALDDEQAERLAETAKQALSAEYVVILDHGVRLCRLVESDGGGS